MPETRVLLIEDNPVDARLVRAHLRTDGRFEVDHVDRLSTARTMLRNSSGVDAVLLDLNLIDSSGLETFTTLYREFPGLPIVIFSGNEDEQLAEDAVNQGAQDYVFKDDVRDDARLLIRSLRFSIERQARLRAELRIQQTQRDLDLAGEIQKHLLPHQPPQIDGFDIAGRCQPAEATSGDFFDFIQIDGLPSQTNSASHTQWDLLVADVSSHGFAPALIMVGARRMLRTCAQMHEDLGQILTIANRAIAEDTLDQQFVTMVLCRIDPATRTMTYCGAGHPVCVIDAAGNTRSLAYTGLPLGMVDDGAYTVDGSVSLQPGEFVLLMTDGVWEAASPDGEQFGQQRAVNLVYEHRQKSAAGIVTLLVESVQQHCHPAAINDDVTVVLAKVEDSAGST